jgi:hypothetical protein
MNTKLVSLLTAFGLFIINAATFGNSAKIGYASDYFYRGAQKAEESVQSSVRLSHGLGGVAANLHACTNQSVDTGNDSYHMGAGVGKSFLDEMLSTYVGINHFEDVPGNALSEVELKLALGLPFSPSVSVYRDLDETLYTFELSVSHTLKTDIIDVNFNALVGNTEVTSSSDVDYYNIGAGISKSVSENASLDLAINYVDADNIDEEFVFGTALTFNF